MLAWFRCPSASSEGDKTPALRDPQSDAESRVHWVRGNAGSEFQVSITRACGRVLGSLQLLKEARARGLPP